MADQDEDDDLYYSIEIDWCRCPSLESIPGKVSGAWVIKGTRMPAQTIVDNYDACMDAREIADAFAVHSRTVEAIIAFAEDYRAGAQTRLLASPESRHCWTARQSRRRSTGAGARWWSGWPDRRTTPGCSWAGRRPPTC